MTFCAFQDVSAVSVVTAPSHVDSQYREFAEVARLHKTARCSQRQLPMVTKRQQRQRLVVRDKMLLHFGKHRVALLKGVF